MHDHDQSVLDAIGPLRAAGFALHWLHPKTKRPIGEGWSEVPVATLDVLRRTHATGNNVGVRTGAPSSLISGGFLHAWDLDIRIADLAGEAWNRLAAIFPDLDPETLPCVISGAGGESRHLYFVTDKAFSSKVIAHSEGKHRGADGKWHYDWEIELFGTGKQVALPPSIHPDTGNPYVWLRPFDLPMLALGVAPTIPSAWIEAAEVADSETYEFELREPLTFEPGQLERDLDDLPIERLDEYADWVQLGQALHHQFGGDDRGFDLWVEHSKRSDKFDGDLRTMRSKYRGFGRNRKRPVTMGTVRQWAIDARTARMVSEFDDLPEKPDTIRAFAGDDDEPDAPRSLADLLGETDSDPLASFDTAAAEPTADDWRWLLDFNEEGAIRPTLHNIALIVRNDSRLVGIPQINEFTQETVQRTAPGRKPPRRRNEAKPTLQLEGRIWDVRDTLNGELWSDDRDFAVRAIFEAPKTQGGYGVKLTDRDLRAAIVLSANDFPFHPIREYLESLVWDGTPRIDRLFIDYVGAADNAYHRSVARLVMTAAVTRVFEPGHKFDFATILEGIQGKRKSTFIKILGRHWFKELDGDFHDAKQMIELMQGGWVLEIPELTGFNRSDVRAIKAFISREIDHARLAYARRAAAFPRQCIFIGSTNDHEYLKDDTGGRRFWPVLCTVKEIDTARLEGEVDQLWAEALVSYRAMRAAQPYGTLPLFLTDPAAAKIAARLQESRRVESADDGVAGRIAAWLDKPMRDGGFDDKDAGGEPRLRDVTCLMQIFCEGLGGHANGYDQIKAQTLGRAMLRVPGWFTDGERATFDNPYGRQRAYYRDGSDILATKLAI